MKDCIQMRMMAVHWTQNTQTHLPDKMAKLLQWNIRGLQANREELELLISQTHPSVICLQETFLKKNKFTNFKRFSSYHNFATEINGIVHGGSSVPSVLLCL